MKSSRIFSIYTAGVVTVFLMLVVGAFSSCSKGDTGPAGPQGLPGDSGVNGVANISSSIFTVTSSSWVSVSTPNYRWVAAFTNPTITGSNVDAVEAYWSTGYGEGWIALPDQSIINQGDDMGFRYNNDSVTFSYYTGGSAVQPPSYYTTPMNFSTILFKVTVIPPSVQIKYPGTNWNNAAEVARLPEVQAALDRKD